MASASVKTRMKKVQDLRAELTEEQHNARLEMESNIISVILGKAGSGKTFLACYVASQMFLNKEINKITITRPTVTKEEIGFLPGDIDEKLDPWVAPIYSNMYQIFERELVDKMVEEEVIEIVPVSFMRGRTFSRSAVIVDEAQNLTDQQLLMVLSRIGHGSKMFVCGDLKQIDLHKKMSSGLRFISRQEDKIKGLKRIELKNNHRHPIVDELLDVYHQHFEL